MHRRLVRAVSRGARLLVLGALVQACWCGADGPPRPPRPAAPTPAGD